MDRRAWAFVALVAVAGAGCASAQDAPAAAEEHHAAAPAAEEHHDAVPAAAEEKQYTQEEEMAAWMAVATPGPEHERMASDCGDWTVASKAWMVPGAPPEETEGKASMRMVLDGRFQEMDFEGSMMGMPFRGRGLTGYDRMRKKYVGTWCDSMGTMIIWMEGDFDADSKVLTMRSKFQDPLGRPCTMRMTSSAVDADHLHWEMFGTTGSQPEQKMMEMDYTRVK